MKRSLIFILSVVFLATVFTSCDKDDPIIPIPDPETNTDHEVLWSYNIGYGSLTDIIPAVDNNDNVYFSIEDMETSTVHIIALNDDGEEKWRLNVPGQQTGPVMYVDGNIIFSTGYPTVVYCVDASSGANLWSHDLTVEYDFFDNPNMAINNNKIYVLSNQLMNGFLLAYDMSGNELWIKEVSTAFNLSVSGTALYFHDTEKLFRYNDNGSDVEMAWEFEFPSLNKNTNGFFILTDLPIGEDGNIYVRIDDMVIIVKPDGTEFNRILLDNALFSQSYSHITVSPENDVLIGDSEGDLVRFQNDGNVKWTTDISNTIINPYFGNTVTIAEDGSFYDAQAFGLYCVKSNGELDWKVNAETGGGVDHGNLHPPVLNNNGDIISVSSERSVIVCFKGDGNSLATKGWPKAFGGMANTCSKL